MWRLESEGAWGDTSLLLYQRSHMDYPQASHYRQLLKYFQDNNSPKIFPGWCGRRYFDALEFYIFLSQSFNELMLVWWGGRTTEKMFGRDRLRSLSDCLSGGGFSVLSSHLHHPPLQTSPVPSSPPRPEQLRARTRQLSLSLSLNIKEKIFT